MEETRIDYRIEKINKDRKKWGLPPIRYGYTKCLKCGRKFYSKDLANIRLCKVCSNNTRDK